MIVRDDCLDESVPTSGADDELAGLEVDIAGLEGRLGVRFARRDLAIRALAHRSWCAENGQVDSNERLEFLGDSVLGLVITSHVFATFPELPEGQLSEVRAGVVNARVLADLARELELGQFLLLGRGEHAGGGRDKASILADAFEAVIAAVYLDSGLDAARDLVLRLFSDRVASAAAGPGGQDSKTRLQEFAAANDLSRPRYVVRDEGPDHAKRFFADVVMDGKVWGSGTGRSKKEAEQAAALEATTRLQRQSGNEPLAAAHAGTADVEDGIRG